MSVYVKITQDRELIAILEDYDGPIPRVGEYIFHPALDDDKFDQFLSIIDHNGGIAGCVKTVTWGLYQRPRKIGVKHFIKRRGLNRTEVEITI